MRPLSLQLKTLKEEEKAKEALKQQKRKAKVSGVHPDHLGGGAGIVPVRCHQSSPC